MSPFRVLSLRATVQIARTFANCGRSRGLSSSGCGSSLGRRRSPGSASGLTVPDRVPGSPGHPSDLATPWGVRSPESCPAPGLCRENRAWSADARSRTPSFSNRWRQGLVRAGDGNPHGPRADDVAVPGRSENGMPASVRIVWTRQATALSICCRTPRAVRPSAGSTGRATANPAVLSMPPNRQSVPSAVRSSTDAPSRQNASRSPAERGACGRR